MPDGTRPLHPPGSCPARRPGVCPAGVSSPCGPVPKPPSHAPSSGPWNPGLSRPPVGPTSVPHSPFSVRLCGSAVCGLPPPSLMVSLEGKPPKFQEKSGWTVLPSTVGGFRGRVPTRGREGNLQWHLREAPLLLIQSGLECGELLLRSRVCCTLCSAAPCRTFCHSFLLRISLGLRCTWSGSLESWVHDSFIVCPCLAHFYLDSF